VIQHLAIPNTWHCRRRGILRAIGETPEVPEPGETSQEFVGDTAGDAAPAAELAVAEEGDYVEVMRSLVPRAIYRFLGGRDCKLLLVLLPPSVLRSKAVHV